MIREQTLRTRQKLVNKLPISGELLRGSLLERTVRHTKDCPKCARGGGQPCFRADGDLSGATDAATQRTARAGCRGPSLAEQSSEIEGSDRGCLRTQSRSAAPRAGHIKKEAW